MSKYVVTGTVPVRSSVLPTPKRTISVETRSKAVAEEVRKTFEAQDRTGNPLFVDVTVEEVK